MLKDTLGPVSLYFKRAGEITVIGPLTLDIVLHFFTGVILAIILLKKTRLGHFKTFLVILILAVIKEFSDSNVMTYTFRESLIDIISSIIYILLVWGIKYIRLALKEKER